VSGRAWFFGILFSVILWAIIIAVIVWIVN
jgi:hypothetical protein